MSFTCIVISDGPVRVISFDLGDRRFGARCGDLVVARLLRHLPQARGMTGHWPIAD
jgi:hypothetical protein